MKDNPWKVKLTSEQRSMIAELPYSYPTFIKVAEQLGVAANYVSEVWYRRHPEMRRCDCGNPAYKHSPTGFVCERCDAIEHRREAEESARHIQKQAPWQRGLYSKYAGTYCLNGKW